MTKAVYIVLGSNYDVNLEYKMQFIQQLILEHNYTVDVFSIDMKPVPANPPDSSGLNLTRISLQLNTVTINELIKSIKAAEKEIDFLIILDTMDFKGPVFANQIVDRLLAIYPKIADSKILHFISPNYENPVFNGQSIDHFDFTQISLMNIPELSGYITNPKKLEVIDKQIFRQTNPWYQLQNFLDSTGFEAVFSDQDKAKKIILNAVTKHICEQIDLNKIDPQSTSLNNNYQNKL